MDDQHPSRPLAAPPGQFTPPPPTASAPRPSPLDSVWGGATAPVQFRVRYNHVGSAIRIVCGSLLVLPAAIYFGYSSDPGSPPLSAWVLAALGIMLVVQSIQELRTDLVLVSPSEVRVSHFGSVKTHSIAGVRDLQLARSTLYRRSDGQVLVKLNSLVANSADVAQLKALVDSDQPASTAPTQTAG